ncbi:hypothetical protein CERSUDRAFT_85238 [Gelatoporia subvermispora B]|uniref:WW domain-containing protein n=1 Tax=Ceriporiopsis subvermispora (strain B) TaxID=914234 RepID=M2RCI7_CERS8|nr:hypothetical protein CERSUDRAFT_85238 [Gelatoporia subvermispora B]
MASPLRSDTAPDDPAALLVPHLIIDLSGPDGGPVIVSRTTPQSSAGMHARPSGPETNSLYRSSTHFVVASRRSSSQSSGGGTIICPDVSPMPVPRFPTEPFMASSVTDSRYHREPRRDIEPAEIYIPPLTMQIVEEPLPEGWTSCTHPEGVMYLLYKDESMHMFTHGDIRGSRYLNDLVQRGLELYDILRKKSVPGAPDTELFLECRTTGAYRYYFINHKTRSIFWLEQVKGCRVYGDVPGVQRLTDIKFALETQYWAHCESFPHERVVPAKLLRELKGTILHSAVDCLTTGSSTSPFTNRELTKMLKLIDAVQLNSGKSDTDSAFMLARFMKYFVDAKFFNFHGQADARLKSHQAIFRTEAPRRSRAMRLLSWLLFRAPETHAREFQKVWVDCVINDATWKKFMKKLVSEWQELTIYATVLLNANVAFLAVPGVINNAGMTMASTGSSGYAQTAAQIASYVSIVLSIGAIILGLLLVRQNRTQEHEDVDSAVSFLSRVTHLMFGLESLAYIFGLPYALLMWSVVYFVLAVACLVFQQTTTVTRILVGIAFGIITVMIAWSLVTTLDSREVR